jgi:hypothetical protein
MEMEQDQPERLKSVTIKKITGTEKTSPDVESLQYIPEHSRYVSGNGNGRGSWTTEPATLTIVGKYQELVFKTPMKEAAPAR